VHHRYPGRVLVLASTGKAVDVAMRDGAGDEGLTVAKALQSLRDNSLQLKRPTLVVVDEAAMVGTDDLRQLLTATTTAGVKTVVHSAQGVTAATSHAVLGEHTSRALLYVAMTRGRLTNTAHIYSRNTGDHEYGNQKPDGTHVKHRGDSRDATALVHGILANHDQLAITARDHAEQTPATALPNRVRASATVESGFSWSTVKLMRDSSPKRRITPNPRAAPANVLPTEAGTWARTLASSSSRDPKGARQTGVRPLRPETRGSDR